MVFLGGQKIIYFYQILTRKYRGTRNLRVHRFIITIIIIIGIME